MVLKLEIERSGMGRRAPTWVLVLQNGTNSNKQCELECH